MTKRARKSEQSRKKDIQFEGASLTDLRGWPQEAKQAAGFQLDRVEHGRNPDDWKPMTTIGQGVREIRIAADARKWRVIYVQIIKDTVHVLHCFQKTTQKTAKSDIDIAKSRLKAIKRT